MKLLINASNLHVGGGVQVATSVINEVALMVAEAPTIHVLASSTVDHNLRMANAPLCRLASYRVRDSAGLSALWERDQSHINGYDAVFTVFGPLYARKMPAGSVVGFAQPWIIYPDNEIARRMSLLMRLRQRLRYWLQARFFSRADMLVVELEHVRQGLLARGIAREERVRVVNNSLSALYSDPSVWQSVNLPPYEAGLRLGFLGRNYAHKNTALFTQVHRCLREQHGLDARLYVTFSDEEWGQCDAEFRACAVNVGPLSVVQCPAFYQALDGVFFPSLLECFSATPLEAMAMERPLFASDRAFNRDVCGEHAHYFDPTDACAAANCIANYFRPLAHRAAELAAARQHALSFSNSATRARKYLACLYEAAGARPLSKVNEHV